MTKSIARQLVFFTIAIVSSSIVYSAAPSLLSIEGVNPDGRYNQGDTVNITAKFDDFISTSPNSQMSVTLNVGPETVDVPLTFSATSLVDKSFGVPNTVNAKGKGDTSSEGIVMATELKVGANAGRIVIVGSFTEYENSGTGKAKMMVLNSDGTIYKTFTSNNSSSYPYAAPQFDAKNIQMVFETSEGKILVGGEFTNVWGDTAIDYLVQLNADFTLDTAFMDNLTPGSDDSSNGQVGSSGTSGTYGSANYYSANTPVVEQDGKLYIAGDFTQIAGVTTRHIACLNLDGTFCSGFTSPFTGGTRAMSLAIDGNKLWVVGQNMTVSGAGTNVDVWRLNLADGSVDNTYVNRLTGDLVGGIVVLPEVADGGVGGVAISGNSLDMAAHTSSSNGGTAVSAATNKPLFVINDDGTQNTNWSVQGNTFAFNPWSGEGFQIVKDKLFFGMHYAGNDLSADDIRDAAGYYKSLNSTACPSNTANGNNSTSDTCGVSSLMVFNLNDGSINQEFMDIIKAQGSFIKIDSSDDVHDFELLSDGGLLVVGSFSSYRATGAAGDSADDEAMIVKFRFDQLSGSYTVRSPSNDLTGLVKSTGISSYQISNIFDSSNVDTDGNAAYANLVSTNQRFEDNTKYAFNRELANAIELYAEDNSYPVPTVQDYIDAGATGVTAANLDDVNAAIDSLVGADVDTLAEIQSVVNAVNTDSDSDGVNNFFDTCPGTPSGLVVNASGCPAVASAPTVNPTSGNEVSGTAQAGSTVEVKNTSGALLCTTVADSSGNYICTPLSPVPSDGVVLNVTADNSAGPSAAATATVDSAAPNAPIILVSNAAELSGTAEANSTVTIKDASGAVVATTTAGPDGIYTFNPNPLIDGALGSATSTDAAGNESVPTLFGPVDAAAPTAPSVAVSNAGELSGTAEANSTVTIKDASGAVVATTTAGPDGSYSFTPNPLADGQTGSVTAKDAAGNESPETAITAVDATAPTAPTVAVSNAGELSGTAEANSTVTIKDASGAVVETVTAGPDGSYSFTPNPLADGQTGSVTAKDAAGNESPETAITAVDATAPAAPTVAVSNAGELSGTAEANSTVTIKDATGAVVETVTAGPDGSYSFTPNPLADGQTGSVTAEDAAGNESPATAIGSVDATAPTAPVVTVSNAGELSGTAEAGSTVTIKDASGVVVATTTAGPDGSYSFTPNPLADGQTGSVTAKDAAGNESPATSIGSVDATAPIAPTVAVSNAGELSGTAEANSTVTIKDASGAVVATVTAGPDGSYSFTPNPLADGESGSITAKDAAGNESPATSIGSVDATAPIAPTVAVSNAGELSGTAEANSTVTIKDATGAVVATTTAGPDGSYSFTPNPLADGQTGSVTAKDAAGNESPATSIGSVDATAPIAPTVAVSNAGELSGIAEANSTVTINDATGAVVATVTAGPDGSYSFTPNPLADGQTGSVTAKDAAGNESPATAIGSVDATAPNAPSVDTNNATELSGTAEANSTVTIKDASGAVVATTTAGPDGSYSFTPNPLADGQTGSVTAKDAAGNESPATAIGSVDATAPTAPVVAVSNAGELSGTAEANSTVTIKDASGAVVATTTAGPDGIYTFNPNPLIDGALGSAISTDAAGNESVPTLFGPVDAAAPTAPSVAVSNAGELSGTAEANSTVTIKDASGAVVATPTAGPDGSYSFTPNPLADGQTGSVTAKDAAGNESPATAIGSVDATAPTAPVVAVSNAGELSGTAEANSTVTIKDASGAVVATTTAGPDGSYSFTPNPLADGQTGSVTAKDAAGNESPATAIGSVDATAPTAPVVAVSNAGELSGTAEANSTVTIKDASGAIVATTTAGPDGSYSFTPNPLADGQTGSVTAKDAAGNESPATAITAVDATAPTAPVVAVSNAGELSGTAEANSTVTIKDASGAVVATTTAGPDGSYSFTPNPLADGQTGSVTAKDAAGNESPATAIGSVDATAPNAPSVDTNNATELSGTAEANSTVTIKDASGAVVATTTAGPDGSYSFTPNPLADGQTGSVTAKDAAGNESPATAIGSVDATAPTAPVVAVSNAGELSGTAEANSTVTIKDTSGAVVATTTAGPDGSYSFTPNPLADGQTGSVTAKDAAGNESPATAIGSVDATAPTAPVVTVSNAGELSGTAEAGSTVTIKDASGAVVATTTAGPDGSYSFTPNPLADGQTGSVTAKDAAGNESPATAIGSVDATAPTAPIVAVSNAGELSGTAEANSTVTIKDASGAVVATTTAGPDGSYSFTPNPLADGQTGSVTAKDAAGNESPATAIGSVDATAPTAPVVAVSNAGELSGTAEANSTVAIKDASGAIVATTTAGPDGSYSFTPNPLADGQTGSVTAKDAAGNESPATAIGSVDATAPTAPVVAVSNAGELSGTAEANSTVTIKDASGAVVATTTAGPDGSYSFTPNPLADGQTGSVTAKDAAGNESPATVIGSVDSTAPAAPLLNPSTGVEVTGTAEVASTVTITDAGGLVLCTTVAGSTGNFSCVLSPVPSEGDTVFATSKDAAGNESIASSIVVGTDTDGDGIPDVIDTDDDNDGLSDTDEINIGTDPLNPDSDNDGVEDGKEVGADTSTPVDSDGDGTIDALDNSNDSDLDGLSNYLETLIGTDPNLRDSDSDDFRDDEELAVKLSGVDSDDDGIDDALDADVLGAPDEDGDGVADFAIRDTDGNGTPDVLDTDSDVDGIDDINETLVDGDGDGIADVLDPVNAIGGGDSDGDFIPDAIECCHDSDKDGQPDYMQLDSDSDRINDVDEAGISGVDTDNDGYDDTYDADVDGDGVVDNGPDENADGLNDDWMPLDTDGDGLADYRDTDSDNDGISDEEESGYGSFPNRDTDGDGIPDRVDPVSGVDGGDSDGDGLSDKEECADGYPNCADSDGDGIPDYMDALVDEAPSPAPVVIDTDGDGLSDDEEATLGTDPLKSDTDDDGLSDFVEVTIGSNPIVADTDGDGILDGAENQDINGNGINDTREGYLKTSTKGGALGFIWAGLALLLVRRKHLLAVLAGLLSMVSVASANESESLFSADRVYVGAGLNYSRFSPETAGTGINITDRFDWGYSLSAGYDLFNQWSVNASYEDAGGLAADVLTTKETLDYKALSLLGRWYPTFLDNNERYTDNDRSWHWFVSGGFATVDTSGSLLADEQSSATLAYGIGANYQITESMLVEATVNRYSGDLLSYGLGITWYPFSNGSKKIEPAPEVIPEPEPEVVEVVEPEVVEPVVVEPVVEIQPCTSKSSRADILFDTNSSKLKSDFFDILDRAVVDYFACEESVITLVGFTDSSGSVRYNEKLSYKRADTVRTYLQERGIPSDHIVTISRGIDPSSGLPENEKRRVELYFGSY